MIKILSAEQLHQADQFTISSKQIASIDLVEEAADRFCDEYDKIVTTERVSYIFCGPGNNGGDGLAIARLIYEFKGKTRVYILEADKYSEDFMINLQRLKTNINIHVNYIRTKNDFPPVGFDNVSKSDPPPASDVVLVDALFGTGLNKPLSGLAAALVEHLNKQKALRVAVDIPSGLFADRGSSGIYFQAHHTITFQSPKLSFFFPENYQAVGEVHVVNIGLDEKFISSLPSKNFRVERADVTHLIRQRKKFDHKGKFGHAFIHAGSTGKMGAAILCANACARSGAGLTTVHIPKDQSSVLNIAVPEVMTQEYEIEKFSPPDLSGYTAFAFVRE